MSSDNILICRALINQILTFNIGLFEILIFDIDNLKNLTFDLGFDTLTLTLQLLKL